MTGHKMMWDYAHSASVFSAVLLFTAGFLCMLLWTNNIVPTTSSVASAATSTFTYYSPAVSTFTVTYNVVRIVKDFCSPSFETHTDQPTRPHRLSLVRHGTAYSTSCCSSWAAMLSRSPPSAFDTIWRRQRALSRSPETQSTPSLVSR